MKTEENVQLGDKKIRFKIRSIHPDEFSTLIDNIHFEMTRYHRKNGFYYKRDYGYTTQLLGKLTDYWLDTLERYVSGAMAARLFYAINHAAFYSGVIKVTKLRLGYTLLIEIK